MVLPCFEFEEVEFTRAGAEKSWASSSTRQGVDARCFEVLQDADQYLSQDTCIQHRIFDDDDHSESLFSSASCIASCSSNIAAAPAQPQNVMAEMLLAEKEGRKLRPCWDHLIPHGISPSDRASVVDSMTRAAAQLNLTSDVLFLGVSLLDRTLSAMHVQPSQLDMTAIACLWIAAKYEHCVIPPAVHFLAAAQADFTSTNVRRQLVEVEACVLQALGYRISVSPTTKTFLRTIFMQLQQQLKQAALKDSLKAAADAGVPPAAAAAAAAAAATRAAAIDPALYFCASYLAEMSLLECKLVPFLPSQVAAAAFASASLLVGGALHDTQLLALSGYSLTAIKLPMQWLLSVHHVLYQGRHLPPSSMYETARKYRRANMCRVGNVPSISSTDDPRLRLCQ